MVKTYVLDASALVSYLGDLHEAQKVGAVLKDALEGRALVLMSVVNWGEVYSLAWRHGGEGQAEAAFSTVLQLPIRLVDADLRSAMRAAEIKQRHGLHFTDCFAAELALRNKATLITSDTDFRRLGQRIKIDWLRPR
jgi:predicted nucleic acid-binding protein